MTSNQPSLVRTLLVAAALMAFLLTPLVSCAQQPSNPERTATIEDIFDRYNFAASGSSKLENAHLGGWSTDKPDFTWDKFFRGRIGHYDQRFGAYPAGIMMENPFGHIERQSGQGWLVADQYLHARDGYGRQFGPQPQVVNDFTEACTRWVNGEYTDGERKGLAVYLGQLDTPEVEWHAAHGTYLERLREALAPVDAIPSAIAFFDSANDLALGHLGTTYLHERLTQGKPTGIEPRPVRDCPHLFNFHVTGQRRSLLRTDPDRHPDAAHMAANWQIQGKVFEMLTQASEANWETVQETLDRGNVPCVYVLSGAFVNQ